MFVAINNYFKEFCIGVVWSSKDVRRETTVLTVYAFDKTSTCTKDEEKYIFSFYVLYRGIGLFRNTIPLYVIGRLKKNSSKGNVVTWKDLETEWLNYNR